MGSESARKRSAAEKSKLAGSGMAKLCVALGLCAAAAFFSLSQFATRRGRQGDDVKALCTWLTSSSVPERVRQWALTSPLLDCAALLSQQQVVPSAPSVATSTEEDVYKMVFPATTEFSTDSLPLSYEEFTSTRLQEERVEETTTMLSYTTVMALENEQTTDAEASTQLFADSSTSHNDALTSAHTIHVSSQIEEYQTGWSGKATHPEAELTAERKDDTQESLAEDYAIVNQDPRTTAHPTVADKNAKPERERLTPKPAITADNNQGRQAALPTVLPLQSSNGAHREITTFSNLAIAPQQKENTNDMATTEFEVNPQTDDQFNTFFSVGVTTGDDHATNEFIATEISYANIEQKETQSTIHPGLLTHMRQGDEQLFSPPTTPLKPDMEDKTTSLPVVLLSTLSKHEEDPYVSVSISDKPSPPSTELPGASKPSLEAVVEDETTTAPLQPNAVTVEPDENTATPDSVSSHLAQQLESDITVPYDFVQHHDERDTSETTSNLPFYTSPVPITIMSTVSDIVTISEDHTSTTLPLPESPSYSNDKYNANPTALDTPAPAVETVENTTTEKLTTESQEETSHASLSLLEHSSSFKQLGDTTAVIASSLANAEKATTTEPTPEEPEGPKMVCYFPAWSFFRQGRGHYTPEDIDPHLCTHIIYGSTSLDNDSLHLASADYIADGKFHLLNRTLALKAINRRLKVLLSLGGWKHGPDEDYKCSRFASNATARRRFVHHAATFVAEHRFDGLNVDWASFGGDECDDVSDKRNFVLLLQGIREALDAYDPPLLLTAAIAGNVDVIRKAYDVAEMFNQTDFTSVMAYDYFGSESPVVAHYSPLQSATGETNPEMSIEYVLNTLIAMGAPLAKLVLGVPFYARSYTLANPRLNYIGAPAKGKGEAGPVTATPGVLAYYEICSAIKAGGWTTMMDPRAGVYAYSGDQWVCFDGPRSLMRKARFALKMGLAGLMASDVSMDDFRGECGRKSPLLNAIHRVFHPQKTAAVAKG